LYDLVIKNTVKKAKVKKELIIVPTPMFCGVKGAFRPISSYFSQLKHNYPIIYPFNGHEGGGGKQTEKKLACVNKWFGSRFAG
jgi:hypothetical protein